MATAVFGWSQNLLCSSFSPAPTGDRPITEARGIKPKLSVGSSQPVDKEWSALATKAGKRVAGRVLEVVDSPLAPGRAELLVSLFCQEAISESHDYDYVPTVGLNANDYRVLVRDSVGRAVRKLELTPKAAHEEKGDHKGEHYLLLPGYAVGAMIPLREYFDLKQPGEYWVLVSLPSPKAGQDDWVAEPVKVRVDGESAESKK